MEDAYLISEIQKCDILLGNFHITILLLDIENINSSCQCALKYRMHVFSHPHCSCSEKYGGKDFHLGCLFRCSKYIGESVCACYGRLLRPNPLGKCVLEMEIDTDMIKRAVPITKTTHNWECVLETLAITGIQYTVKCINHTKRAFLILHVEDGRMEKRIYITISL